MIHILVFAAHHFDVQISHQLQMTGDRAITEENDLQQAARLQEATLEQLHLQGIAGNISSLIASAPRIYLPRRIEHSRQPQVAHSLTF